MEGAVIRIRALISKKKTTPKGGRVIRKGDVIGRRALNRVTTVNVSGAFLAIFDALKFA